MKRDFYNNPKQLQLRVLNAFVVTFFHMLTLKSFESLTVNDICINAGYPRATFYNYFDSKEDLLDYYFYRIKEEIRQRTLDQEKTVIGMFSSLFDYFYEREKTLNKVLKINDGQSYLLMRTHAYIARMVKLILYKGKYINNANLPRELVADYYAQCFLIVLRYRFDGKHTESKEEILRILKSLIHEEIKNGN